MHPKKRKPKTMHPKNLDPRSQPLYSIPCAQNPKNPLRDFPREPSHHPQVLNTKGSTCRFEAYESDAIVKYLFQTYGDGIIPLELSLGPLTTLSCSAGNPKP